MSKLLSIEAKDDGFYKEHENALGKVLSLRKVAGLSPATDAVHCFHRQASIFLNIKSILSDVVQNFIVRNSIENVKTVVNRSKKRWVLQGA